MAINETFDRLRKAMERGLTDDDRSYLSVVEKQIKKMRGYEVLAENPAIKDYLDWCKTSIKGINRSLSTDRELQDDRHHAERLAMMEKKDVLMYFIGLFDTKAALDALEKELADRAEEFEQYQSNRS